MSQFIETDFNKLLKEELLTRVNSLHANVSNIHSSLCEENRRNYNECLASILSAVNFVKSERYMNAIRSLK